MESDCSDDEADLFFSSGPADSSFAISLQRGCTPSPKKKQKRESLDPLPKKFRPRDSGVVLNDSDDDLDLAFDDRTNFVMAAMPRASTSMSTVASSFDDHELVTPGLVPSAASGWPTVVSLDDDHLLSTSHSATAGLGRGVDAFILRTLVAGGSVSTQREAEPKRVPGTPVKKVKTAHLVGGVTRPWQSAVAHKIGFKGFDDPPGPGVGKGKGKPRKSLPAAFPGLSRPKEAKSTKKERQKPRAAASASERDTDVDLDDGDSPTVRRDAKYDGLGLGRPTTGLPPFARPSGEGKPGKAHWLMRRSSSGAFSTAGDASSVNATPTRLTPKGQSLNRLRRAPRSLNVLCRMDAAYAPDTYPWRFSAQECLAGSKSVDFRLLDLDVHRDQLSHSEHGCASLGCVIPTSAENKPEPPHTRPSTICRPQRTTTPHACSSGAPSACTTGHTDRTTPCIHRRGARKVFA